MQSMRRLLPFFCAITFIYTTALAQPAFNSGGPKTITGKIVEKDEKTPVEFAAVAILKTEADEIISASLSDMEGRFLIEVPGKAERVKLEVTFVGYRTLANIIDLGKQERIYDLGNIILEQDQQMLEEVLVTAEQATMNLYVDRKVYNVEKDISAKGGTGEDIVKNIPGVELDAEGSVQIRNAGAQIFIDGRPTQLELDKIPADQIESIEVITNPSAKFDASSAGGIINIRLKKNRKKGYNGTASIGAGTTDRYNALINLNINKGAFNTGFNYSFNNVGNNIHTFVDRQNFSNGNPADVFRQDNSLYNSRRFHNARWNIDYQLKEKELLSWSANFNNGAFGSQENQTFSIRDIQRDTLLFGDQYQDNEWAFQNYTTQLYYQKRFSKPGRELSSDINYNRSNRQGTSALNTNTFDKQGNIVPGVPRGQEVLNTGITDQLTYQLDYVSPQGKQGRFEAGLRAMYKWSQFDNIISREVQGQLEPDPLLSNAFEIRESVNAAYVNYVNATPWFNYQAGLRFEHSYYSGRILDSETTFFYEYPGSIDQLWKALFPALFLSKKYAEGREVQINFSRKIGRPGFWQLNPTVNINDPRNLRFGNPDLRPEFINLGEINHSITANKMSLLSTVYGRLTEDPITWVNFPFEGDEDILVTTAINGQRDFTYGLENIWKWYVSKRVDFTLSANTYMVNVSSNTPIGAFRNSGFTYDLKPNMVYRFPADFTFQISGNYRSPRILPQGRTQSYYFMDVSLAKKINKSWNANLIISDVFNTKLWGQIFETPFYFQEATRRREARYARITLSYSFGKGDKPKQRKRQGRQDEGRGSDDGDF
jgi:outer membrane receptor protein involved in Fe transport